MEFLLIACMLAYAAGSQSEQSKLGLSPAQRDILRERTRHEKAVQKIADKHGVTAPGDAPRKDAPGKDAPATDPVLTVPEDRVLTLPEAFRSGYRSHTPIARITTPMGRRAGTWTAHGVAWARDTGRGALRVYRERRKAAGGKDPAPVLVPLPPAHPPTVPKMPDQPPPVGTDYSDGDGVDPDNSYVKDDYDDLDWLKKLDAPAEPSEPPAKPPADGDGTTDAPQAPTGPEAAADEPTPIPTPRCPQEQEAAEPELSDKPPATPVTEPVTANGDPVTDTVTPPSKPVTEPDATVTASTTDTQLAPAGEGVGRMAGEVNYDSVKDESDELSLMCREDLQVYGRIQNRCKREIGRGDSLIAALQRVNAGDRIIAWVTRGKEQYGAIHSHLHDLAQNTIAQDEGVVKAKALLEAGQGVYANIAEDMENVAERDFYLSDAVDSEDTTAHTETYETRGA